MLEIISIVLAVIFISVTAALFYFKKSADRKTISKVIVNEDETVELSVNDVDITEELVEEQEFIVVKSIISANSEFIIF